MGRRAKDCRPDLMRFGFRHTGAEQTAALGTGGHRHATRRRHAHQAHKDDVRAAESDEFIGVAAVSDDGNTERGGQQGEVAQLMTRKLALEGDTQLRITRTTCGPQRTTSSSELLRCWMTAPQKGRRAAGEVTQLMTRKQELEADTQLRMTRTARGVQRVTSSSELLRCWMTAPQNGAGSEVKWRSSGRASKHSKGTRSSG